MWHSDIFLSIPLVCPAFFWQPVIGSGRYTVLRTWCWPSKDYCYLTPLGIPWFAWISHRSHCWAGSFSSGRCSWPQHKWFSANWISAKMRSCVAKYSERLGLRSGLSRKMMRSCMHMSGGGAGSSLQPGPGASPCGDPLSFVERALASSKKYK